MSDDILLEEGGSVEDMTVETLEESRTSEVSHGFIISQTIKSINYRRDTVKRHSLGDQTGSKG